MKCRDCPEEISERNKCGLCRLCYSRDYKIRNKEKIRPVKDLYYRRNKKRLLGKNKAWRQENGYSDCKTPRQRHDSNVRRKTRLKYPLEGQKCEQCPKAAEHRHHTTNPLEIDKFLFLCEFHHLKIHGNQCVKEVENE